MQLNTAMTDNGASEALLLNTNRKLYLENSMVPFLIPKDDP